VRQGYHNRTDTRGIAVNKQALSLAVFIAGAYPAASNALGLGDIESSSHLNQPLHARIELLAANAADANQIQVRLASPDVFNRVGVARPDFLSSLRFTPSVQGGKPVILVTSDAPIQEPFVNFLLEVSWPQGQLLKEYTVMLDPPVMLQPGNTVAGSNATVRAEPKAAGNVRRPQPAAASEPQYAAGAEGWQQPAAKSSSRSTYVVRQGDTLFRVAGRLQRPGVSNEQMMMALFRANPNAFINRNINNLKAGVTLRAPGAGDIGAVSRAVASRQIRQHNAEWREFRKTLARSTVPQTATATATRPDTKQAAASAPVSGSAERAAQAERARLEVLGAKPGQTRAADATAAAASGKLDELEKQLSLARESLAARQKENDELKSRVTDLESMLDKKGRLIELRNGQLAALQKQLADGGIKVSPLADNGGANPPEPDAMATPSGEPKPGDDIQNHVGNTASQQSAEVLRSQPANNGATPPQGATSQPGTTPSGVGGQSTAPETPAQPVAPLAPPASQATQPVPLTPPALEPPSTIPAEPVTDGDNGKNAADPFKSNDSYGELFDLLTSPQAMMLGAGALALLLLLWLLGRRRNGQSVSSKRSKKSGLSADMDPPLDHVLSDDDFATVGSDRSRDRGDYGNAAFDAGADDFSMDGSSAWDDIPTQPEQSGSGAGGKATDGAHAGHQDVEDDLLTEANVYIAYGLYQQAESELKKGIERSPEKLEYRHKLLECYFVANNREAFDRHAEQFAAMTGKGKDTLWKSILEWGRKISPDNRLYQDGSAPASVAAVAAGVATVAAAASAAVAHHAEPAMGEIADDFAVHTGGVDGHSEDTPVSAALDELDDLDLGELDFDDIDLDKLLKEDERTATSESAASHADSGNMVLDSLHADTHELDLDFAMDEFEPVAAKADNPADFAVGDEDSLLDFITDDMGANGDALAPEGDMHPTAPVATGGVKSAANLNLHLDNSNLNRILPKDTFYAPADAGEHGEEDWLGDIDDALSFLDFPDEEIDLHEAHISTKLDLARAYLDMGDIEGARSTLEEVMVEGNDDQRREAEVLLHQTG
jgi:pilus assembly protein FimV